MDQYSIVEDVTRIRGDGMRRARALLRRTTLLRRRRRRRSGAGFRRRKRKRIPSRERWRSGGVMLTRRRRRRRPLLSCHGENRGEVRRRALRWKSSCMRGIKVCSGFLKGSVRTMKREGAQQDSNHWVVVWDGDDRSRSIWNLNLPFLLK